MAQYNLSVVGDFGSYRRGDLITDQTAIAAIMATDQQHHVRKVALPPAPAAPAAAAPAVALPTPPVVAAATPAAS